MIAVKNGQFHLQTEHTSYIFQLREGKYLEHLHYGKKVRLSDDTRAFEEKTGTGYGNTILTPENQTLSLENICLEYSSQSTGDFRELPIQIQMPDYSYSNEFIYESHRVYSGTYLESDETKLPYAKENKEAYGEEVETLDVTLKDSMYNIKLHLIYTIFPKSNIITRRVKLTNGEEKAIRVGKIMSMCLDLYESDYRLDTFDGAWVRERQINEHTLTAGTFVNASNTGASSNRHNPFILLAKEGATEHHGSCFGMNLIYSGNHYEAVEVTPFGKLRVVSGINPHLFDFELNEGESFYTPEAVLTYSADGKNGVSHNMHRFILNHIIPATFAYKERPILINNWEATYFEFTESKLLKLAKEAKELGVELFVLDDGWFGQRNSDKTSLGDWTVNEKKLGGTLNRLSEKIHQLGMQFGLWFEPEMISEESELYKKHPDWAVKVEGRRTFTGRNQLVLDLTRNEVCDYIVESVCAVLSSADINYVKWDMNRHISDAYSAQLGTRQGEFYHRYIIGLYDIMKRITEAFPHILFEGCSAGGNRFDLGILSFMPQIWTSDNTDANERIAIQEGTSYGYPPAVMGAHVSAVPNHQTLRNINLETRFNVASFGLLGYELDLTKLTKAEQKAIKEQIAFYKEHRKLFQFGTFTRVTKDNNLTTWQVTSNDQKEAFILTYQRLAVPNHSNDMVKATNLCEDICYDVSTRKQYISIKQFGDLVNQVSPISITNEGVIQTIVNKVYMLETEKEQYQAYGDWLMNVGIKRKQQFAGTGYSEETRIMSDFGSRIYHVTARNQQEKETE